MAFLPEAAKVLAETIPNSLPVFGSTKGQHLEKAYRFEFTGGVEKRHISIATKATKNGITVYVNKRSTTGAEFPAHIGGITLTQFYPIGHEGKNGEKGLSGAAARLPSLNPASNEVLRLSIESETAFQHLLDWYTR